MLVLERFETQGIRVDDHVLFEILSIDPGDEETPPSVKVGILAPRDRTILREELWNQKQIEQAGLKLNKREEADANHRD